MKIYRNVYRFEVLSNEPLSNDHNLKDLDYFTSEGSGSGMFLDNEITNEELQGKEAIQVIRMQSSDPEFFDINSLEL